MVKLISISQSIIFGLFISGFKNKIVTNFQACSFTEAHDNCIFFLMITEVREIDQLFLIIKKNFTLICIIMQLRDIYQNVIFKYTKGMYIICINMYLKIFLFIER
jgi:hypothetical protein